MNNIESASPKQISAYLNSLKDIAIENSTFSEDAGVWADLYDIVFSENVSRKIFKRFKFDYYDPDASYREDVCAFIDAFDEYAKNIEETNKKQNLFPTFANWLKNNNN